MKCPAPIFYLAAVLFVSLTTLASMAIASDSQQSMEDMRQETQIRTIYMLSPYLREDHLTVSVHHSSSIISGTVGDHVSKALAAQIAASVEGVIYVDNQILVEDDYLVSGDTSQSAYGEFIDDASITAAVKAKLLWSRHTSALPTHVATRLGRVTLTGTADSRKKRENAEWLARNTRGVTLVRNDIVVIETRRDDSATAEEIAPQMPDRWITAKVLAMYRYSTNISSANISVTAKSGVVTLVGKVEGAVEMIRAIELAQNVIGVTRVISRDLVY